MLSPLLLWSGAQRRRPGVGKESEKEPSVQPCNCKVGIADLVQWLPALEGSLPRCEVGGADTDKDGSDAARSEAHENGLILHGAYRRSLYLDHARQLSQYSDAHDFYRLMMWCHDQHVFIHPSVQMRRCPSTYRDHTFVVGEDVDRLTPLFAVPESLVIGFKDSNEDENSLRDEEREKEFNRLNTGEQSDADICQFFFDSLSMIVSDLITSMGSPLTDPRWVFAELLGKVRSMKNAPYFEDDVVLDPETLGLADVLLQMIRNYINGGPLVGKVDRSQLRWAVSVCLSHSTPLVIGTACSIGIIPMVHLFPHGGKKTNSFIVSRTANQSSAARVAAYFAHHHQYDFMHKHDGRWIYVVPARPLKAGEEICMQAMAPVCGRDSEAEKMWRLSCGTPPDDYMPSAAVARQQAALTNELMEKVCSTSRAVVKGFPPPAARKMARGERGVTSVKKQSRKKRGGRRRRPKTQGDSSPLAVPPTFICHICAKNHWTVHCPRLRFSPGDYPLMDPRKGCWKCAQRGHTSAQCQVKKYHCSDCGGLHDTRDCEFDHKSEEWHEFFDVVAQHLFYWNSVTGEVQWTPPTHKLDVVLWFCANCEILLPTSVPECVKCHVPRPQSKVPDTVLSSSSSTPRSGSDDDSGDEESETASA